MKGEACGAEHQVQDQTLTSPRSSLREYHVQPPAEVNAAVTPRPAYGLWALCVILGGALLLMWAEGRAKPLLLYPVLIGGVLGLWTRIIDSICHMPPLRWSRALPGLCAVIVTTASLGIAAQRWATASKPKNPLAEQLLRQFDQQSQSDVVAAESPAYWTYLCQRYSPSSPSLVAGWFMLELFAAVGACLIIAFFPMRELPDRQSTLTDRTERASRPR